LFDAKREAVHRLIEVVAERQVRQSRGQLVDGLID
jgi:hypothetical protein